MSLFLSAVGIDRLTEDVRQESQWIILFADDIVICNQIGEQMGGYSERLRFDLESTGMKDTHIKAEKSVDMKGAGGMVRLQGAEKKKTDYRYL